MRIAESVNLEVNEALLTGESEPGMYRAPNKRIDLIKVDKITDVLPESEKALGDQKNMGFMSTLVVKGKSNQNHFIYHL